MRRSPPIALGEADITIGTDDDVVEHRDATEFADLAKPGGELNVGA
jgi:hypothetical protein